MIKNDLLATKMKQLSELITKVLSLNEIDKFEESRLLINDGFKQLIGLNPDLVERLPYNDLINFISAYETAEVIRLIILAELLKISSDLYKLQGNMASCSNLRTKSLNTYITAALTHKETTLERCHGNLEQVVEELEGYELPVESSLYIMKYYELINKFDKAEDILYDLIDTTDNHSEVIKEGINFYERLLQKPVDELEQGNLPIEEVKDGLNNIKKYV